MLESCFAGEMFFILLVLAETYPIRELILFSTSLMLSRGLALDGMTEETASISAGVLTSRGLRVDFPDEKSNLGLTLLL